MGLREQYSDVFAEWEEAGGVESNFRDHLLAIGVLPVTIAEVERLADQVSAKVAQLKGALASLPK